MSDLEKPIRHSELIEGYALFRIPIYQPDQIVAEVENPTCSQGKPIVFNGHGVMSHLPCGGTADDLNTCYWIAQDHCSSGTLCDQPIPGREGLVEKTNHFKLL